MNKALLIITNFVGGWGHNSREESGIQMASQRNASFYTYSLESVVCSHHVYKVVWTPFVGENLALVHAEPRKCHDRCHDRFAVCLTMDGGAVGHVPPEQAGFQLQVIHEFMTVSSHHVNCTLLCLSYMKVY